MERELSAGGLSVRSGEILLEPIRNRFRNRHAHFLRLPGEVDDDDDRIVPASTEKRKHLLVIGIWEGCVVASPERNLT